MPSYIPTNLYIYDSKLPVLKININNTKRFYRVELIEKVCN